MKSAILVQEWNSDEFHQRVTEMESKGYVARLTTYKVTPEMNPETGVIIHLHSIEMCKPAEERE